MMQGNTLQSTGSLDKWNITFVSKQHSARCLNSEKVNTVSQSYHRFIT